MGAPQADQRQNPLGIANPNFDFSFCESTFEWMSPQTAPELTHKSIGYAFPDIFLFSNEQFSWQILNIKKIYRLDMLSILH